MTSVDRCAGRRLGSTSSPTRDKTCSTLASCDRCHAVCLKMVKCNGKDFCSSHIILNSFRSPSSAMYCEFSWRSLSSHHLSSSSTVSTVSSSAAADEEESVLDCLSEAPRKSERQMGATFCFLAPCSRDAHQCVSLWHCWRSRRLRCR